MHTKFKMMTRFKSSKKISTSIRKYIYIFFYFKHLYTLYTKRHHFACEGDRVSSTSWVFICCTIAVGWCHIWSVWLFDCSSLDCVILFESQSKKTKAFACSNPTFYNMVKIKKNLFFSHKPFFKINSKLMN